MKNKAGKITKVLSSLLLLISPLNQIQSVFAESKGNYQQDNSKLIEKQLRNEPDQQTTSKKTTKNHLKYQQNGSKQLGDKAVRVIVEVSSKPAVTKNIDPDGSKKSIQKIDQATDQVINNHDSIKRQVESITGTKARRNYGYLINGFSISAKPSQIQRIKAISGVKSVTISKTYQPLDTSANQLANVQKVWSEKKLKGEGTVISIIDSGIDAKHQDLKLSDPTTAKISQAQGNSFAQTLGYGKALSDKVPFAYNYADANSDTVWDTGTIMHGMHVAGIAAANGKEGDFKNSVQGVAPEAQLLDMKVFGNGSGGALDDDIISAIEDSVKLGADVINLSLGMISSDSDDRDPMQAAVSNAAKQGVIPVIAAGNSGMSNSLKSDDTPFYNNNDNSTLGSPGVTSEAITVASSENQNQVTNVVRFNDPQGNLLLGRDLKGQVSTNKDFSETTGHGFYLAKNGKDNMPGMGYSKDFDDSAKGKIAVVTLGEVFFEDIQENAKAAGAVGVVIIDDDPDNEPSRYPWNEDFPTLGLSNADGKELVSGIKAAPNTIYTVTTDKVEQPNKDSGRMSSFTSYGPTTDLSFKPDITAPGGKIWSTANDNKYQSLSGTSMASPFIAGATAVLVESLKQEGVQLSKDQLTKFAKISLMNTAKPMMDVDHEGNIVSPRQQGSGSIQLDQAVDNRVTATTPDGEGSFALKEIGQNVDMTVTLNNRSDKDIKYTFNDHGGPWTNNDELKKKASEKRIEGASLTTDSNSITVPAKGKKEITIHLSLPMSFAQQKFVEGYIGFDSETAPKLVVPYMGFHGKWGQDKVIDNPAWEKDSVFGGGIFRDELENVLGSDLGGSDRFNQNSAGDFTNDPDKLLSHINPDTVAISPNNDGHQDIAKPDFYLYRNAKNISAQIINSQGSVIKTIKKENNATKSVNVGIGFLITGGEIYGWDGTRWNAKSGKNEPIVDGVYKYRLNVTPHGVNAKTQSQDLTIRVDTVKPKISDVKLIKRKDGLYLNAKLYDNNSGIQNKGVFNVTINGVPQNYNLEDGKETEEIDSTSRSALKYANYSKNFVFKLNKKQAASLTGGKNQIETGVLDNAANYGYNKTLTQAPGKSAKGLVVYNLYNGKRISPKTSDVNAKNKTFQVKGSYSTNVYINGRLAKIDKKGIFSLKVPIPTNGVFKFSADRAGKKLLRTIKADMAMKFGFFTLNNEGKTINTDKKVYEISGMVHSKVEVVLVENEGSGFGATIMGPSKDNQNREYTSQVGLSYGSNKIKVTAIDIEGNTSNPKYITINTTNGKDSEQVIDFDDEGVADSIEGFPKFINTESEDFNPTTGEFKLTGKLKRPVGTFKIGGEDVNYDSKTLKFSKTIKVPANGYKVFSVVIKDQNGKMLADNSIRFMSDTIKPTLSLNNSDGWKQDSKGDYHLTTMKKPFILAGTAEDNFAGLEVFVNDNIVDSTPGYISMNHQPNNVPINFSTSLNLIPGLNKFQVKVKDGNDNVVTRNLYVNYQGI